MKIACPDCNAAYEVPAERLAPGRTVRCARCGGTWTPVATEDAKPPITPLPERVPERPPEPGPEPVPEPVPEPRIEPEIEPSLPPPDREPDAKLVEPMVPTPAPEPPTPPDPAPIRRRGPPVLLGWALTAMLLAGAAYAAYARRADIMQAWPPSIRIYATLGLLH